MPTTGRTRQTIRTAILNEWSSRYVTLGLTLRTDTSSDVYREAHALALDLVRIERMAELLSLEPFPKTSTGSVKTALRLRVTGTDGARTIRGRVFTSDSASGSRRFTVNANTVTLASRVGAIDVTAEVGGAESNLAVGATVTIDLTVTGLDSTATVSAVLTRGEASVLSSMLERHGAVYSMPRQPAVATVQEFNVSGTDGTKEVETSKLVATNGLTYEPTSSTFVVAGGVGVVAARCTTTGANTRQTTGATLTWDAAPAGVNATATASGTTPVVGSDTEPDADYSLRIVQAKRARPASSNPADWVSWAVEHDACTVAFCYPLLSPTPPAYGTVNTLGCVTVIALGPAPGINPDSVGGTDSRFLSVATAGYIKDYIEGTRDRSNNAVSNGKRLRPVMLDPADYTVEGAINVLVNVEAILILDATNAYPWVGTLTVNGASDSTHLVVNNDGTFANGLRALVYVGGTVERGGFRMIALNTGVYDPGPPWPANTTVWTFAAGILGGTPSGTTYPGPANWDALRRAVYSYIDGLGTGSADAASWRGRYPTEAMGPESTVHPSAIVAALMNVPGVLNTSIVQPAAAVTMLPKQLAHLQDLILR